MNNLNSNKYVVLSKVAYLSISFTWLVSKYLLSKYAKKIVIVSLLSMAFISYAFVLFSEYLGEKMYNYIFKEEV